MSTPDDGDAERTTDWPGAQNAPADDGEATTVVPKTPQQSPPPPMSPPPRPVPPPPMSPPQAGQWDTRWNTPPMPGYPPGPYPPVAAKPPKGPRWGLLGIGALALVVIAVTVTVFVTRGGDSSTTTARSSTSAAPTPTTSASASTPSTTAADVINPAALKGLLSSVPEINQLADNAMMTPSPVVAAPFNGATVTPVSCAGAVNPGIDIVYLGSSFTGFAGQLLDNEPQHVSVMQALASFPGAADAQTFVDQQFADWQHCNDVDITQTVGNETPQYPKVATSAKTLGTNTVFISVPVDSGKRECQRAMSARKNLVVDVRICAANVGSKGWTLARDIGEKITGQR
ncbi:sensor domain-containing protein [Mycobacterium sp. AZCC_0083]|uniref:sensor domain-containing protein n=1 Tax=Mycobacterium sp. AZCC_0083 TaxID=2735882 RepID=UPI00160EC14D|nr:sensor domain-containing protein [Mycobacterium sp. AZCC_0083]MBB5163546.1 hypothetical protein [Mycobacterium sp. AZCC_0083]